MNKFRGILKYFSLDIETNKIAQLTGLNCNTVKISIYFTFIREIIAEEYETKSPLSGDIEVDESFFGAHRVKRKMGRGASGKTVILGLLKYNGKVYTRIVPNCSSVTLLGVILEKVPPHNPLSLWRPR
jgi:transposase